PVAPHERARTEVRERGDFHALAGRLSLNYHALGQPGSMRMLDLAFHSGEDSLSVRRFSVREAVSTLFEVEIEARSPRDDLAFEELVGQDAVFRMGSGSGRRVFQGVCSAMEQTRVEADGLSTYVLRIVPALWLLTQRRNYRVFQHLSAVEIARALLAE